MNKNILFSLVAIFCIAVVSCVCINAVHASTFDTARDCEYVYDEYDNVKYAKNYGADFIVDARPYDDPTIHKVEVKNYDKYLKYSDKKGTKVFKYKDAYDSAQFGKLSVKKVKNDVKRHLREYDDECCHSKLAKAVKLRYNTDESSYKVIVKQVGKTKLIKKYYYDYKPVKKTVWKTVKWNTVQELWNGVCKLPEGYKYSYNTYKGSTIYSHYKKTITKYKKVKRFVSYKTAKYKVIIKIKYKKYDAVKKIVNKPCKVAYVY